MKTILVLALGMVLGSALTIGGLWLHFHHHGGLATRVAGEWTGSASVAGTEVDLAVTLERKGNTISGHLTATPGGSGNFQGATIDGQGNISFSMTVSGESVTFTGKAAADGRSMAGRVATTSYGEGTWQLTKHS